jgi:hypothetical protein
MQSQDEYHSQLLYLGYLSISAATRAEAFLVNEHPSKW